MAPVDPPRTVPERLLTALVPPAERDEMLGDLRAEREVRARRDGEAAASLWLWRQTAASVPALLGRTVWRGRTGFESTANRTRPGGPLMESWIIDLRFAVRRLGRRPLYALLAVGTLALGVGGAAAISGIVRGLLLGSLPYAEEARLGIFWGTYDWSEAEHLHLRPDYPGFSAVAAYTPLDVTMEQSGSPTRLVPGIEASAELFDVLGTPPALGRAFRVGDDVPGVERVAVVSHGLWRELGGDPAIVGRTVTLDGKPRTVVGVMPRGFWFPSPDVRVWLARPFDPENRSGNYSMVGRLAPDLEFAALPSRLERLTARIGERFDYPAEWDKTKNAHVTPLRDVLIGPLRPALWAAAAAMALILLIACANVAALTLGQIEGRTSELAARVALGAERGRLAQQLVAEAVLLAGAAALAGGLLAAAAFRLLVAALPLGVWAEAARVDGWLFTGALLAAFVASLLVALPPLVSLWRGDLRAALATRGTVGVGFRGGQLETALVVTEVALAVLIASGTALLVRSVSNLYAVAPGVETEGLAVIDVVMPGDAEMDRRRQLVRELIDDFAALPGVERAAASHKLPLRGTGSSSGVAVEGHGEGDETSTYFRIVTPGYFETLGYRLVAGRTFTAADRRQVPLKEGGEAPVVVNESLAEKYFPGADPLGRVLVGGFGARERIVGVVGDAAEARLADPPAPARYWLADDVPFGLGQVSFVLRVARGLDPASVLEPAAAAVARRAPSAAVRESTTLGRVLDQAVGPARQVMRLLTLLTVLAVVLGAVGVYGVLAHFVGRRHRDWAIRMALGFAPSHVVTQVVRRGALLVSAGVGLGWLLELALARLLDSLLFDVAPGDPWALAAAGTTLLAVGLAASLVPAWRASRTQPARLLRDA